MTTQRFFVNPDTGDKYPVSEATHNSNFQVYRSDVKKSIIGDPCKCLLARGLKKDDASIIYVFITSGNFAYVVYHPKGKDAYCIRFKISTQASRVRDAFDARKDLKTQTVKLTRPSLGRTLEHRAASNKRRRQEIKNGAPVKARGNQVRNSRIMKIGVAHRPKAHLVKNIVHIGGPLAA
jgi:hypothetical protein